MTASGGLAQDMAASLAPDVAAASVTVATVAPQDFVARAAISGSVVARNAVSVVPQISGYAVTAVNVDIGDTVAQGDVLATLDTANLRAQLAQVSAQADSAQAAIRQAESQIASAQAQADEADQTLNRTQQLFNSGSAAQSTLDQVRATSRSADASLASAKDGLASAQSQLRQVQAQREIAELNLAHALVVAPVSGVIASRNINLGDIASGASPAFVIYQDGALEITAAVVETALSTVKVGDRVALELSGLPQVTGTVRLTAPTVDPATRLGSVNITPDDATGLRAGLFAGGWIITQERQGLGVPAAAVQTDASGNFVYVVNDGVLAKTSIEAGLLWQGYREVLSGLNAGDVVVARAGAFFADGDRITPVGKGVGQ